LKFKLPYGLKEGNLVHISSVEKGLKCGCVCPACNHPLIARKGEKTIHHFAHHNGSECAKGIQTALHLSAKDILEKHKRIQLPKVEVDFDSYKDSWVISEEMKVEFDEVKLEKRLDSVIPDVLVYVKGRPLLIEITVTHKTDSSKVDKIKRMGFSCLEIDLSNIKRELSIEDLEEIVIDKVEHKRWLHNEKSSLIKKKAISLTEKKKIVQRGFANHVDLCPIETRVYRGKPYANVIDDCLYCEYCLQVGDGSGVIGDEINCSGKSKINNYEDLYLLNRKS
jgi:hypothetical protein